MTGPDPRALDLLATGDTVRRWCDRCRAFTPWAPGSAGAARHCTGCAPERPQDAQPAHAPTDPQGTPIAREGPGDAPTMARLAVLAPGTRFRIGRIAGEVLGPGAAGGVEVRFDRRVVEWSAVVLVEVRA